MISSVRPLQAGNALQVFLSPPASAVLWRVLRKPADDFTGENDPNAVLVVEGTVKMVIDAAPGLVNETPAFYKAYYWDNTAWTASATGTGTPQATYQDNSTDVLELVRYRLEVGLQVEVARGALMLEQGHSAISVFAAPPAEKEVQFPVVTVHLENESPGERGIGELVEDDTYSLSADEWTETEGYLADVTLEVGGWSVNPEERINLRKALRRIIVANFPIFDDAGMVLITFRQRDVDYLNGEYTANVYTTMGTFDCKAPVRVSNTAPAIAEVEMNVSAEVPPGP